MALRRASKNEKNTELVEEDGISGHEGGFLFNKKDRRDVLQAIPRSSGRPKSEPACPNRSVMHVPTCMFSRASDGDPLPPDSLQPPVTASEQHALLFASLQPPVTTETLKELNMESINNNISLGIDVNYDFDLHFQPVDGQKLVDKLSAAELYWTALTIELRINLHDASTCAICISRCPHTQNPFRPRLPEMFSTLKALLESLVPKRDHDQVTENLDVDLNMQQVRHGVFDARRMSQWLVKLLTTHCAPMRDAWAYEMADMVESGASDPTMSTLVGGLKKLFSFLEAMKLDVANHQIRTLKFMLIENTIERQQLYFRPRVANGTLIVDCAKRWIQLSYQAVRSEDQISKFDDIQSAAVLCGLIKLCNPMRTSEQQAILIPSTLRPHDEERLRKLRSDIEDILFTQLALKCLGQLLARMGHRQPLHPHYMSRMTERLWAITGSDKEAGLDTAEVWTQNIVALATEFAKCVIHITRIQRSSLQALTKAATGLLGGAFSARSRQDECLKILGDLMDKAAEIARTFSKMTPLQMAESQRKWQTCYLQAARTEHQMILTDIAGRLAHLGVLHWRVWADLVYFEALEELRVKEGESSLGSGSSDSDGQATALGKQKVKIPFRSRELMDNSTADCFDSCTAGGKNAIHKQFRA